MLLHAGVGPIEDRGSEYYAPVANAACVGDDDIPSILSDNRAVADAKVSPYPARVYKLEMPNWHSKFDMGWQAHSAFGIYRARSRNAVERAQERSGSPGQQNPPST
jgi:hypothetical protein